MITITIETDNAAFEDNQPAEVARILRTLAEAIARNGRVSDYTLRDINGNKVGTCTETDA